MAMIDNNSHDEAIIPTSAASSDSVEKMLRKVVNSPDAFFKHQQREESDLSETEKYSICYELYSTSPFRFLARYYTYLDSEDIVCFKRLVESVEVENAKYELDYYLTEMAKRKPAVESDGGQARDCVAKNRRYAALKRLIAEGKYFSDYEMRDRDPLLYDRMIGQFQTESEQREAFHSGDREATRLSTVLMDMFDSKELSKRRYEQQAQQVASNFQINRNMVQLTMSDDEEELEDDDDEELELDEVARQQGKRTLPDVEKQTLREEFIREMQERFLDGKDDSFDYRTVDDNPEFDPVDLQARDAEDKYFDEEEPQDCPDEDCDAGRRMEI